MSESTAVPTRLAADEATTLRSLIGNLRYQAGGYVPTDKALTFNDVELALVNVTDVLVRLSDEIAEKDAKIARYENQRRVIGEFLADVLPAKES